MFKAVKGRKINKTGFLVIGICSLITMAFDLFIFYRNTSLEISLAPLMTIGCMLLPAIAGRNPLALYGIRFEKHKPWKFIVIAFVLVFIIQSARSMLNLGYIDQVKNTPGWRHAVITNSVPVCFAGIYAFLSTMSYSFWEEALVRGLIQRTLSTYFRPFIAITLQAIFFGALHIIPLRDVSTANLEIFIYLFMYTFLVGLLLGYLQKRYNSILPCWYIHWSYNLITVMGALFLSRS